jgi:mono/diheme cytochrome c family protein
MKRFVSLTMLVGGLVLLLFGIPGRGQESSSPTKTKEEEPGFLLPKRHAGLPFVEEQGRKLYDYYCALCHGAAGGGDGFNSYILATPPAKLADPSLMAGLTDAQITAIVTKGGKALGRSPLMPPWGGVFKARDVTGLIAYLRTLSKQ